MFYELTLALIVSVIGNYLIPGKDLFSLISAIIYNSIKVMDSLRQVPLRLPAELHDLLKRAAKARGMSLNQYCLYILTRDCDRDSALRTERGEETLRFIAESRVFQTELNAKQHRRLDKEPTQTPWTRYQELYGHSR